MQMQKQSIELKRMVLERIIMDAQMQLVRLNLRRLELRRLLGPRANAVAIEPVSVQQLLGSGLLPAVLSRDIKSHFTTTELYVSRLDGRGSPLHSTLAAN